MSDYSVIAAASDALRRIVWEDFNTDATIRNMVDGQSAIVFSNPTETRRDTANRLSIWLYRIAENEFLKNQPMQRPVLRGGLPGARVDTRLQPTPLALNLFYLVTPFGPSGDADHLLLGRTMRVLYDNAIVELRNDDVGIAEELRIALCQLTLEELTRIWEALQEPYRLSVCYQVQVTRIDSTRQPGVARVVERRTDFSTSADPSPRVALR